MLRHQNTIRLLCTVREIECGLLLLYNVMDIAEDISISLHELKATTNQVKSSAFSSAKEEAARCSGVWLSILINITLKIHEVNSSYEQASGEEKHFFLLIKRLLEMWSRAADLFTLPPSGIIILDNSGEISILPLVIHLIYLAIQVPSLIHVGTNTLWIILRSHLNRFSEISASICQNIIPVILSDSAVAVPLQRDTMLTEKLYQCIGMLISIIPSCDTSRQLLTDSVLPRITTQLQTSLQRLEECRIEKVFGIISTRESDVNDRKRTLKICSYHLSCMKGLIQGANFRKQVMEEDNSGESDDESDDCEQVLSNDNVDVDIFSSHIHSLVSGLLAMVEVIIKRNSCAILRRDEVESTCLLVDRIISVIAKLLESRDASLVLSEEIVHRLLLIFIDSNFPATEIPNLLIILVRQTSFTSLNGDTPSSSNPDQWTHQKLMQMLTAAILFQCDKFTFLIKSKDPLIGNSFVVDQCILYFSNCLKLVRQWSISQPVLIISNISTIIDKLGNFSNSNPALKIFGQCITAAIVNSNQSNLMSFSLVDIYLNSLAQLIELPNWIVFDANILRLMSSSLTTLEGCHHTLPADVKLVFATVVAQRCQAIISVSLQQLILQVDPRCNRMLSLVLDGLVCILYKSHDFSAHSQIFQILLEVGTQTVSRVFNRFMMSVAALAVEEQCNVSNIVAALFEEVHILLVDALAAPSAEPILSSIQSQPRTKQVSKWIALAKLNSVKDILAITKL